MAMFVASLVPISLMTTLRFALGDSMLDYVIAVAAPCSRSRCGGPAGRWWPQMHEDARLRFQVEDLARELEETRDEALQETLRGGNRQCLQDRLPGQYEP